MHSGSAAKGLLNSRSANNFKGKQGTLSSPQKKMYIHILFVHTKILKYVKICN